MKYKAGKLYQLSLGSSLLIEPGSQCVISAIKGGALTDIYVRHGDWVLALEDSVEIKTLDDGQARIAIHYNEAVISVAVRFLDHSSEFPK